ncbi:MAG: prolipoprotein diacylglyceryl transferase [Chlamydiae bacterium]|nr:prolipoprotein diacylglyceryl transferase [Chlamydiota bacterium]
MDILAYFYWDPQRELFSYTIPFLNRPPFWYGLFFAVGFFLAYFIFRILLKKFLIPYNITKREIAILVEKCTLFVVIGTIIGARLGDVLFYQDWDTLIANPIEIIKFWEGGLASHGAIVGIFLSLWFFSKKIKKDYPMVNLIRLVDLMVIPACLAAAFIRIGNFFNQEILGIPTDVSWAVMFGHPADGTLPIPRHPVQLYESAFYLFLFFFLSFMRWRFSLFSKLGKLSGYFFMIIFTFRLFIEHFKEHQSRLINPEFGMDVGQILSIPFILLGIWLAFFMQEKSARDPFSVKRN